MRRLPTAGLSRGLLGALVVAVAVAVVVASAAIPAAADHTDGQRHWGHGFRPYVSTDCGAFGGRLCDFTSAAERAWSEAGYGNGWNVGGPYYGCSLASGWIRICVVAKGDPDVPQGKQGVAITFHVQNPTWHADRVLIKICGSCGTATSTGSYTSPQLASLVKHEYGHAIGLGHTTASGSVMRDPFSDGAGPGGHDPGSLRSMYSSHEDTLTPGLRLDVGEHLLSRNRSADLVMQGDGNLVLYGGSIWATGTDRSTRRGRLASWAVMQEDGNLVLYTATGVAVCSTRTFRSGSILRVQDDDNVVIVAPGNVPVWSWKGGGVCWPESTNQSP